MALPNGSLLQVLKIEEIRAARAIKKGNIFGYLPKKVFPTGKETIEISAIGKIDDLEIRLQKRVRKEI